MNLSQRLFDWQRGYDTKAYAVAKALYKGEPVTAEQVALCRDELQLSLTRIENNPVYTPSDVQDLKDLIRDVIKLYASLNLKEITQEP